MSWYATSNHQSDRESTLRSRQSSGNLGRRFDLLRIGANRRSSRLSPPVAFDLTFNDMLRHLLSGRFDIDPEIIGGEGFVRNDRTYTYFGVAPVLPRIVLLPFSGGLTTDITAVCCWAAAAMSSCLLITTVAKISDGVPANPLRNLVRCLTVTIALGGPVLPFLKPSIFQEVMYWSSTVSSAFILCTVQGVILEKRFSTRLLAAMAVLAGLGLNTRVTTGVSLFAALGALMAYQFARAIHAGTRSRMIVALRQSTVVALILAVFVVICGGTNFARWGNPATFFDDHLHLTALTYPDRIPRIERYGAFNARRIPYTFLSYTLLPSFLRSARTGDCCFRKINFAYSKQTKCLPAVFCSAIRFCFISRDRSLVGRYGEKSASRH